MKFIYILFIILLISNNIIGRIYHKNLPIKSFPNSGKAASIKNLPIMELCKPFSDWSIEFCSSDIRFSTPSKNFTFDSIRVCEVDQDTIPDWEHTEMHKQKSQEDFRISLKDALKLLLSGEGKKRINRDTIVITHSMLKDVILKPEIALSLIKLTNRAVINRGNTKEKLLSLLQKEGWIAVYYYSQSLNDGKKPLVIHYKCEGFIAQYELFRNRSNGVPSYKTEKSFAHQGQTSKSLLLTVIKDAPTDNVSFNKTWGNLAAQDYNKTTIIRRKRIKRTNTDSKGGRSRANIMRTVRTIMPSLKQAYDERVKVKKELEGKITIRWAVNQEGDVLRCKVVHSTMNDPILESEIMQIIKKANYGKIPILNDVTEIAYPFSFMQ